eukprot:250502-Chlamydomonas_euryale.AAC.10
MAALSAALKHAAPVMPRHSLRQHHMQDLKASRFIHACEAPCELAVLHRLREGSVDCAAMPIQSDTQPSRSCINANL